MKYKAFATFDSPEMIDTSFTPIPASGGSPLQVIADSGNARARGIEYADSTGEQIGVYVGASGHEYLVCVIGNGGTSFAYGLIPKNSRVSLRAMRNVAITTGFLSGVLVA